jgi:hypothetical protein
MEQIDDLAEQPATAVVEYAVRISNSNKLNLADFQNSVPLLRELVVENDSERQLSHLQLRLESFPPFLKPKTWSIDACEPKSRYGIKDLDAQLDGVLRRRWTEAETKPSARSRVEKTGTAD